MKILLIAYHYPPLNNGGIQRPLKMVKFLPLYEHTVSVLTQSSSHRGLTVEGNELRVYDRNKIGYHKLFWAPHRLRQKTQTFLGDYRSSYRYWLDTAKRHADTVIQRTQPDVIIATYPPLEVLQLGLYLSQKFDIPLVSDFRDGLLFESIEVCDLRKVHIRTYIEEIECSTASRSTALITVSEPISQYFRETYGREKVFTIPNGFDPDDLEDVEWRPSLDQTKFNLVYTGRLSKSGPARNPAPFFEAVERLVQQNERVRNKLRLHFLGDYSHKERRLMANLIKMGVLNVGETVERTRALGYQQQADLLLLLTSTKHRSIATGKIFEYLYTGKPILALTHNTYAETIVRETHTGWLAHPADASAIYDLLLRIVTDQDFYRSLIPDKERILMYSRATQMKRLNDILCREFGAAE